MSLSKKKNCRIDYINKYSVLVDFSNSDTIVYYETGIKDFNTLYGTYKYRIENDMPIELNQYSFFPYPVNLTNNTAI